MPDFAVDNEIVVLVGRPGSGKTVACATICSGQRVICLPTRAAIVSTAAFMASRGHDVGAVFFGAGSSPGDDPTGGIRRNQDGVLEPVPREVALAADIVYVTPYQIVHRIFREDATYIVDEVHSSSLERLFAICYLALSGKPLVLATATPPAWLQVPDLFGRPLRAFELTANAQRVRVVTEFETPAPVGIRLRVFGRLREVIACPASAGVARTFRLHGELSSEQMSEMLTDIAFSGSRGPVEVLATVGVVESSITLGAVVRVTVESSALKRRRYRPCCANAVMAACTRSEFCQILGRGGRISGTCCEAVFTGFESPNESWHTSWEDVPYPQCGPETDLTLRADFSEYLTVIGSRGRTADVGFSRNVRRAVLSLLGCPPQALEYSEACYDALSLFVDRDFSDWVRTLPEAASIEYRAGQDFGRYSRSRQKACFLDAHAALGGQPVEISATARIGLLVKLGPGCVPGAFGANSGERLDARPFSDLLAGPLPVPTWTPGRTATVGGRTLTLDAPDLSAATVAEREKLRLGSRPRVKNVVGTPMGGAANGPALNALASLAERITHCLSRDPLAGITAGDDVTGPYSDRTFAIRDLVRTAGGVASNPTKTHPSDPGPGRMCATPFTEYYACQDDGLGAVWVRPSSDTAVIRSLISGLTGGNVAEEYELECGPLIRAALGLTSEELKAARTRDSLSSGVTSGLTSFLRPRPPGEETVIARVPARLAARLQGGGTLGRHGRPSAHWIRELLGARARCERNVLADNPRCCVSACSRRPTRCQTCGWPVCQEHACTGHCADFLGAKYPVRRPSCNWTGGGRSPLRNDDYTDDDELYVVRFGETQPIRFASYWGCDEAWMPGQEFGSIDDFARLTPDAYVCREDHVHVRGRIVADISPLPPGQDLVLFLPLDHSDPEVKRACARFAHANWEELDKATEDEFVSLLESLASEDHALNRDTSLGD